MKRLSLIAVLVVGLALPAAAQNTSAVNTTGTGNNANVGQIINPGVHQRFGYLSERQRQPSHWVNQTGTNAAMDPGCQRVPTSIRLGNSNVANVNQGDLTSDNDSEVWQQGNNNNAQVRQGGSQGQNTGPNTSTITQYNEGNDAYVDQGGTGAVNNSTITQNGLGAGNNVADVNQFGSSTNNSTIGQTGDTNNTLVNQDAPPMV